jgi:hypothetical protein
MFICDDFVTSSFVAKKACLFVMRSLVVARMLHSIYILKNDVNDACDCFLIE